MITVKGKRFETEDEDWAFSDGVKAGIQAMCKKYNIKEKDVFKKEELNLSKRINGYDPITQIVVKGDIKEFIKNIKKDIPEDYTSKEFKNRVDKLAGANLI